MNKFIIGNVYTDVLIACVSEVGCFQFIDIFEVVDPFKVDEQKKTNLFIDLCEPRQILININTQKSIPHEYFIR